MTKVTLKSYTKWCDEKIRNSEEGIAYEARASNPKGQEEQTPQTVENLIRYCIRQSHWSVLQMAGMTLEIETTRDISAQLIRHFSFRFQEFSQRYADPNLISVDLAKDIIESFEPRLQDRKNRQSSLPVENKFKKRLLEAIASVPIKVSVSTYSLLLKMGVAKEVARRILPMSTPTRLYCRGDVRSWFFYLLVRNSPETQKEHREIAEQAEEIFKEQFPAIHECLQEKRLVLKGEKKMWKMIEKARKAGMNIEDWDIKPVVKDPF